MLLSYDTYVRQEVVMFSKQNSLVNQSNIVKSFNTR